MLSGGFCALSNDRTASRARVIVAKGPSFSPGSANLPDQLSFPRSETKKSVVATVWLVVRQGAGKLVPARPTELHSTANNVAPPSLQTNFALLILFIYKLGTTLQERNRKCSIQSIANHH
jgi:hypothetical protein